MLLALKHEWEGQATALADSPLPIDKDKQNGAHNELLSQIDDVSEPTTFHYFP